MEFRERLDVPKDLEKLDEAERVKRLHHQLGVMYDRVFLSGDWEGEQLEKIDKDLIVRTNIFEDRQVTDGAVLLEELNEFLKGVRETLPGTLSLEQLETRKGRHDFNRKLFRDVLRSIRDILQQSAKDTGTLDELQMMKCVDMNIHYFRDIPHNWQRGKAQEESIVNDEQRATEGLQRIQEVLTSIK